MGRAASWLPKNVKSRFDNLRQVESSPPPLLLLQRSYECTMRNIAAQVDVNYSRGLSLYRLMKPVEGA